MNANDIRRIINILESLDSGNELIKRVVEEYSLDDLFTFEDIISEDMEDLQPFKNEKWDVDYSNAFKKGLKKHSKNPRVTEELKELEKFIVSNSRKVSQEEYPPQYNVHVIKRDPKFAGSYSAHVMGKKNNYSILCRKWQSKHSKMDFCWNTPRSKPKLVIDTQVRISYSQV